MKQSLRLVVSCGVVMLGASGLLSASWELWEPVEESAYSQSADIAFNGVGPASTAATAKFKRKSTGVYEDSVNFTTNSECADCGHTPLGFDGEFDISGQWSLGEHHVEIFVSGSPVFQNHKVFIQ